MAGGPFIQDEKGKLIPCMVTSKSWWKTPLKAAAWMLVHHKWITVVRAEAATKLTSHLLPDYNTDITCFEDHSRDIPGIEFLYTELDSLVIGQKNPHVELLLSRVLIALDGESALGPLSHQKQFYYVCELSMVLKDFPDYLIASVTYLFDDGGFHLFHDPGNHKRVILLVPVEIGSRPYIQDDCGKFVEFPYMMEPPPTYNC
ncbi:hypothetical protein BU17DRAFT_59901 [Hysterangium stoloniferum]|nr:hypothetical protein BU17DRAFT_59901 [Hysterangium stoloniferum]